jgi:hypothetical protein
MNWIRVLTLVGIVAVVGCLGSKAERVNAPTVTPREAVKQALEGIAKTGQGGSAIGAVQNKLKELKETEPALAEELSKEANTLMDTRLTQEEIQTKAKAMLQKLEGGTTPEAPK